MGSEGISEVERLNYLIGTSVLYFFRNLRLQYQKIYDIRGTVPRAEDAGKRRVCIVLSPQGANVANDSKLLVEAVVMGVTAFTLIDG